MQCRLFLLLLKKHMTNKGIIKNSFLDKYFGFWQTVVVVALFVNAYISENILCLNYLYGGIKYTILVLLFIFCYYGIKKTIEKSIIISFLTWGVLNCLSYWAIFYFSQKNECFITAPCKVTYYSKQAGKSPSYGINYIYKGEKQYLHYTNKQLDPLDDAGEKNWEDKIDLRLKLSKFSESIYYINDFYVTIKK